MHLGWKYVPDKIFVLPVRTNTSDLKNEDTVVVEKVVDLSEESLIPANTDVLKGS